MLMVFVCVVCCVCVRVRAPVGEAGVRVPSDVPGAPRGPSVQPDPGELLCPGAGHLPGRERLLDPARGLLRSRT